jgi:NosR/NirI family transcriptional regulator, nitrous oxide reductase regulator
MAFSLSRLRVALRAALAWLLLAWLAAAPAAAGALTRDAITRYFPAPLMVGEKDATLPVWPLLRQNATATELVGYAFESIDFAPVPGFSGVPINLLVAIDPKGQFLDVQVVSHHEPVFLEGLGEAPMARFASQYRGLALNRSIAIDTAPRAGPKQDGNVVHIDGVAKATASVRIINQSVLSSALKVARARLGFAGAADPDQIARLKPDVFERLSFEALLRQDMVKQVRLTNRQAEEAFADSDAAGIDAEALASPDAVMSDFHVALASVPSVGRNLLTPSSWDKLAGRLDPGDHALLVLYAGRYGIVGDDFVAGTAPDRLLLKQNGLAIEMRDLDLDLKTTEPALSGKSLRVFRIIAQSGLDLAHPLELALVVRRAKGMIYPERFNREFAIQLALPARFYDAPVAADKTWVGVWRQRWPDLALLATGLLVLAVALTRQKALTANRRRFAWFRQAYLLFTALFIGWYAQGQLSIVNLTGLLQALRDGRGLSFFLYDPMTVVLWAFVLVSLLAWGRGAFCGWLCPFGALQEFVGKAARLLRLPQLRVRRGMDARLKLLKYLALATILASVFVAPAWTDALVEAEPFKTAITLNFMRSWPFVLYAGGLLLGSAVVYKFFCRYLCPFGAGLAVLGRLRLFNWLPRRKECGKPCQTCRHRCDYEAIRPDGRIRYDDCFQCMDCVVIHQSDALCAPRILEKKRARVIPVHSLSS